MKNKIKLAIVLPIYKMTSILSGILETKFLVRKKLMLGALLITIIGISGGCSKKGTPGGATCYKPANPNSNIETPKHVR